MVVLLGALCCLGLSEKFSETLEKLPFEMYAGDLVDGVIEEPDE